MVPPERGRTRAGRAKLQAAPASFALAVHHRQQRGASAPNPPQLWPEGRGDENAHPSCLYRQVLRDAESTQEAIKRSAKHKRTRGIRHQTSNIRHQPSSSDAQTLASSHQIIGEQDTENLPTGGGSCGVSGTGGTLVENHLPLHRQHPARGYAGQCADGFDRGWEKLHLPTYRLHPGRHPRTRQEEHGART